MTDSDDDEIVKTVELKAPISQVWKALTDHEEFGQWFRVKLDQPFAVDGKSTGQMTHPGHEDVPWVAYIERMDSERVFSFLWYDSDDGLTEQTEHQPGISVEFRLEEIPEGVRLTIKESGFSALPDPRRIEIMRSNVEGWELQAKNLAEHLSA